MTHIPPTYQDYPPDMTNIPPTYQDYPPDMTHIPPTYQDYPPTAPPPPPPEAPSSGSQHCHCHSHQATHLQNILSPVYGSFSSVIKVGLLFAAGSFALLALSIVPAR